MGRRLRVAGDGPEFKRLKRMAAPGIEFCGRVPDSELRDLLARSRALIVPGEEDFGMAPVEALASGKPVVALGRGGVRESVPIDKASGVLYDQPSAEHLNEALGRLEAMEKDIRPSELQASTARFSEDVFREKMGRILQL